MRIAVGSDDAGEALLSVVSAYIRKAHPDIEIADLSAPTNDRVEYYPDVAERVAVAVADEGFDRGILICGTGIGVCIAANKVPGAYAALCSDPYSTERSRKSNNANIMTLGAQVMGAELAKTLVTIWMKSEYTPGGRSEPKIQRICEYARAHQK